MHFICWGLGRGRAQTPPYRFTHIALYSAVAYVTKMGSRKNCVLIFGHCYRCVLTIDRKWKIDVAIFSVEP